MKAHPHLTMDIPTGGSQYGVFSIVLSLATRCDVLEVQMFTTVAKSDGKMPQIGGSRPLAMPTGKCARQDAYIIINSC